MHAWSRLTGVGVVFTLLLAGCADGGRGSSGFDLSEALVIQRVISTQQCESRDALRFCPADQTATDPTPTRTAHSATPTPGMDPTPTPTAAPVQRVDTGLAHGTSIACTRTHAGDPCRLTFSFQALGFDGPLSFRVAAQLRPPATVWQVGLPPVPVMESDPPRYDAVVSVVAPADAEHLQVRFAVLVLTSPTAVVPDRLGTLADSGAAFAFVTADLDLEVITTEPLPTPTASPTAAPSTTEVPGATPTFTATSVLPPAGPEISYFGVARADNSLLAPSDFDTAGRPVFLRAFGSAFSLIIEGRPGINRRPVGDRAFRANGAPDLQIIVSRALGDGSAAVCDDMAPLFGGVPATEPLAFTAPEVADALNDLGCRVDDGRGEPRARQADSACTTNRDGEFAFVDSTTQLQFCLPIAGAWPFPSGDTIVAARLVDVLGGLSGVREIVIRNAAPTGVPTPVRTPRVATRTPIATHSPAATGTASPTGKASDTPTPTATQPTATPTPTAAADEDGPTITYLGLARANDRLLPISAFDALGRPIFAIPFGYGASLVVEAKAGPNRRPPGFDAYSADGLPDLQMILSQALGDGSAAVCDTAPPTIGGVPKTDPLVFGEDATAIATINDLGCRFNDGTGAPTARRISSQACTLAGSSGEFSFVDPTSQAQFCMPVAKAWEFAPGDTVVAARVRDLIGRFGPTRQIIVRVE
ncbi:MAG: hypothetical protein ABI629_19150 [bacterium]